MVVCALMLAGASTAAAQVIGAFRWQLQPYCNIVTLTVVQEGTNYRLEGTDDQCGAPTAAAARGLAFANPNGTIGLGFTIIATPAGTPVHIDATVSLSTISGTWRDDLSGSGPFVFTPGAGVPGAPRPVIAPRVHFRVEDLDGDLVVGGTQTAINTWETLRINVGGGTYNAGTGAYTVPVPGLYIVTATARWQTFSVTTGHKCLAVLRNTVSTGSACEIRSSASAFQTQTLTTVLMLNAGDRVRIAAASVGGSGTVGPNSDAGSHFTVTRVQ
jgi:hypothetical protein